MKVGKKKRTTPIEFEESCGNVFADLGLENPEELLAKSMLITRIRSAMEKRNLTEPAAAKRLDVARSALAAVLRGDLDRFSLLKLATFCQTLELDENGREEASNMKKAPLSDGSGNWFDLRSAKKWHEYVSLEEMQARGFTVDRGEYEYTYGEILYYTQKGSFVLSRWHANRDTLYLPIDQENAVRWLIANGYQKDVQQLEFQSEEKKLEI
ncbi:MAG: XRE family transcriptional regulator [Planctomycetes bacterium]|nr:XRE family transcriptional regulator [Planctomycetota bacterium]